MTLPALPPACSWRPSRYAQAALLAWALTFVAACGGGEPTRPGDPADPAALEAADPDAEQEPVQSPTVAPLAQSSVRLYFPSTAGDGLIAEHREIFETTTPGDRAKQIIAGLIEGPESGAALRALPRGTNLRQAYVLPSGVAYLDFSRDLVEGTGGGSMRELLTVYAIVDSLTRNIPEIKSVGLLVEGKIPDTLNGHLDLRYPLRANYSMVLQAAADPGDDAPVRVAGGQPAH